MKTWYLVILILLLLTVVTAAVLIARMPDTVPAHYNFQGEVDRYGSKYENLIWPGLGVATAAFLVAVARGKKRTQTEAKALLITAACLLLVFYIEGVYFMVKALHSAPGAAQAVSAESVIRFSLLVIGALLAVLSGLMPRMGRNRLFGLRTKWSLYNDRTWQRSQRFAAAAGILAGLLTIASAVFLRGSTSLFAGSLCVAAWVAACVIASYRYYRDETKTEA